MNKIKIISGLTIPLAMNDVDTDLIIPAQYLTSVTKNGYGENLFRRLKDNHADFSFNLPKYAQANILLSQKNFGCGSSREHAVWALKEAGIQTVISSSFADIFSANSFKNGLLLINLPESIIENMISQSIETNYSLEIDIEKQRIFSSSGDEIHFEIDPFKKSCFLNGFDELSFLLSFKEKIIAFKNQQFKNNRIPTITKGISL